MHRRILGLLLGLLLMSGAAPTAFAEEAPAALEPQSGQVEIHMDGVAVDGVQTALVEGVTYVSLPNLAAALRPDAAASWETDRVVVRGEGIVLSAKVGDCYMEANGRYLYLPTLVQAGSEGDTLVPVRTLALALGAQVGWDGSVDLSTGGAPIQSGDTYYDAQSVDLLARIIYHESGNQPFRGQLAVGNVILNRVKSPSFPNTIYDVVYQPNQFPGATSKAPDAEAVVAAKLCLDGAVVAPNAYWFNGAGKPCWASRTKALVATIGNHAFYG